MAQPAEGTTSCERAILAAVARTRAVTLAGVLVSLAVMGYFLEPIVPRAALAAPVLIGGALVATVARLQLDAPVSGLELQGQLLLDVALLLLFFHAAGGATNPFVDLFLVPLALAAARLPRAGLLAVALLTLGAYLMLSGLHEPLPAARAGRAGFQCFGMWVKYALCAGFVAILVSGIATRLREREQRLAEARRRSRSDELLVHAGTLAAGAAHELRSPLCTMAVLVNELQRDGDPGGSANTLRQLAAQIEACGRIVSELVSPEDDPARAPRGQPVDAFLHDVVERWRALRPNHALELRLSGVQPAPALGTSAVGLRHAVLSLLNNAADASSAAVEMECEWSVRELSVAVLDRGPGIPTELATRVGEPFVSTKRDSGAGVGIGLALALRAAERGGGRLAFTAREGGGTVARLVIPLRAAPAEVPARAVSWNVRYLGAHAAQGT